MLDQNYQKPCASRATNTAVVIVRLSQLAATVPQSEGSDIDQFLENLNQNIREDLKDRRACGEIVPDFQINHCWAGIMPVAAFHHWQLVMQVDVLAYEELAQIPVAYSRLFPLIKSAWQKVIEATDKQIEGLISCGGLPLPEYTVAKHSRVGVELL